MNVVAAPDRPLLAQGVYYVTTGISPLLSRRAFEAVTRPKRDWWLVQTVALVVCVVGAALLSAYARRRVTPEISALAGGCAASLAAVEALYVARGRIRPTHLIDAVVQVGLLTWLIAARRRAGKGTTAAPGPAASKTFD